MASKELSVLNIKTSDADELQQIKQRIENAKASALEKGVKINTSKELLLFLLDQLESDNTEKQTPRQSNLSDIHRLINAQMEINKKDTTTCTLKNGNTVFINKRRITSAWVQAELGCSFGAIKAVLDDEFTEKLDRHHKACGIDENHNRSVLRAKTSVDKGQAVLNGELTDVKVLAGI